MKLSILSIVLFLFTSVLLQAEKGAYKNETPQEKEERMQWYSDARFGLFIHWGAYSVLDGEYKGAIQKDPKGEWVMNHLKIPVQEYRDSVVSQFNPTDFDADQWAKSASDAGMKYIVITTKHHDGFALFHSQVSDYNIVDATPFKRDIIKELSVACRKYDLKFGIYYSQAQDWYHPGGYKPDSRWDTMQDGDWTEYFNTLVKGQVTELFTNYGDVSLLWWDSGRATQDKDVADKVGKELLALQPDIIVNPRLGGHLEGDFQTYEQVIPAIYRHDYNELCLTHNRSWSYKASDQEWKSPSFILHTLVQMTAQGGNFLFNVGPDPMGNFPPETLEALAYVGDWMKVNSEAIYGTRPSPFYQTDWGYCTQKTVNGKERLYLHVKDWPTDGTLLITDLHNNVDKAYLLDGHKKVKSDLTENGLQITSLPSKSPHADISVIVLEISEHINVENGYIQQQANGAFTLKPEKALFTIKPQFDNIPEVVEEKGATYIDNWNNKYPHPRFKNTGNAAHWKVEASDNADYKVYATIATRCADNVVSVKGRNTVYYTLPNTGGMDEYQSVEIGTISLRKGVNTITFTGGKKDQYWDYVRLQNIHLELIEE